MWWFCTKWKKTTNLIIRLYGIDYAYAYIFFLDNPADTGNNKIRTISPRNKKKKKGNSNKIT